MGSEEASFPARRPSGSSVGTRKSQGAPSRQTILRVRGVASANSVNSHSRIEGRAADGDLAAAVGASGSSNWPISVSGTGVDVPYSAGQVFGR